MKEIQLTRGKVTIVDDGDYEWLNQFKWNAARYFKNGKELWYAQRGTWDKVNKKRSGVQMQRFIMGVVGQGRSVIIDHADGDGLNNRRINLRKTNQGGNSRNCRMSRRNKSGYRGVSFHKGEGKWRAYISVNKVNIFLGWHDTAEQAAEAYRAAALQHHGELARVESFQAVSA